MRVIRGRKALVTGAAAGLGRAIALRLAAEGADVYLLDIDEPGLAKVVAEVEALGVQAIGAYCDVSQQSNIDAAVDQVLERWGGVDILVNNAGVGYYGPTEKMTPAQWDWLLAINLHAPIRFTCRLLPVLLGRAEAHVLNVVSICGLVAGGRFNAYHTSKFGLVGFSEALRAEYGRMGLGVTAICPGPVITDLYKSAPCGKEGRETPTPPRLLCTTIDRVAKKSIRAIYRDQRLPLVGYTAYALYYLKRLAPGLLDGVQRIGRRRKLRKKAAQWAADRQREAAGASKRKAA